MKKQQAVLSSRNLITRLALTTRKNYPNHRKTNAPRYAGPKRKAPPASLSASVLVSAPASVLASAVVSRPVAKSTSTSTLVSAPIVVPDSTLALAPSQYQRQQFDSQHRRLLQRKVKTFCKITAEDRTDDANGARTVCSVTAVLGEDVYTRLRTSTRLTSLQPVVENHQLARDRSHRFKIDNIRCSNKILMKHWVCSK